MRLLSTVFSLTYRRLWTQQQILYGCFSLVTLFQPQAALPLRGSV